MSSINRLNNNNNNNLISSQQRSPRKTHNSSPESIVLIWKKANSNERKKVEISCPTVQNKNQIFKKLEDGKIALRQMSSYKLISLNSDFVLKDKVMYVETSIGNNFNLYLTKFDYRPNINFYTPAMKEVRQWEENYNFCLDDANEKWTCDQLRIVENPDLIENHLTTVVNQDIEEPTFAEASHANISVSHSASSGEMSNCTNDNVVPVFETTTSSAKSSNTTTTVPTSSFNPDVVYDWIIDENDNLVPVVETSTAIPAIAQSSAVNPDNLNETSSNSKARPHVEEKKRKEANSTSNLLKNKDPRIVNSSTKDKDI